MSRTNFRIHWRGTLISFFVYMLECADNTYYVGCTNNLQRRLRQHNGAKAGARYTKLRRPLVLRHVEVFATLKEARGREAAIKRWKRPKKGTIGEGGLTKASPLCAMACPISRNFTRRPRTMTQWCLQERRPTGRLELVGGSPGGPLPRSVQSLRPAPAYRRADHGRASGSEGAAGRAIVRLRSRWPVGDGLLGGRVHLLRSNQDGRLEAARRSSCADGQGDGHCGLGIRQVGYGENVSIPEGPVESLESASGSAGQLFNGSAPGWYRLPSRAPGCPLACMRPGTCTWACLSSFSYAPCSAPSPPPMSLRQW